LDEGRKLREARTAARLSQSELARRTGISRQALSAIESGAYQPGVRVALSLARALGATVESLFGEPEQTTLIAAMPARNGCAVQARVALARVGGRLIATPLPPTCVTLSAAGGLVTRELRGKQVEVDAFRSLPEIDSTLIIAGCDPGMALVRDYFARHERDVEAVTVPASSQAALAAVAKGETHAAGVHLRDPASGDYNVVAARATFGNRPFRVVNFARWELGLASRKGRPPINSVEELMRPGLRLVNRPPGSGARAVLDETLGANGVHPARIEGYQDLAAGHLEVAAAIAAGTADAGVTIRLAANLYDLHFTAWREERYDLVIAEPIFHLPLIQRLVDVLNSPAMAHEIAQLCAYDTSQMGVVSAF
jgi:molybdate-binding protein/DNA-binding XRE family transcriptional regulator